jgi:hypothetical protein
MKPTRGLNLREPRIGFLQTRPGVNGKKPEFLVDIGIADVLFDILVTMESHRKDLGVGKQALSFETFLFTDGAPLGGLKNNGVEGLR